MNLDRELRRAAGEWQSNYAAGAPPRARPTVGLQPHDLNLELPCVFRAATRRGYVCVRDNRQVRATNCRDCRHRAW
jgi:hypothetical protein